MNHDSIALALSGGVDSAVAAALLQEQGFKVYPFFFRLGLADQDKQQARAENIGRRLGLVSEAVDLEILFQEKVLDYFCRSYYRGITPNPCVVCNSYIKFAALLQEADRRGFHWIATGHYARTVTGCRRVNLYNARDDRKDQSYFLCGLGQKQLSRTVFPLGDWTKDEVRARARLMGLADLFNGDESRDVCFLKNNSVGDFVRNHCAGLGDEMRGGEIIDRHGRVLDRHSGIFCYTIGQRRGIGVPDSTPYYVVGIDPVANQVIAGKEEDLWQFDCLVSELNWLQGCPPELPADLKVKIRYRHPGVMARISTWSEEILVEFAQPQRAVTPGQFAVFYRGDEMLGGGRIQG